MVLSAEDRSSDKFNWRCNRCGTTRTVRHNSYFEKSRLPLDKMIKIIFYWALQTTQTDTAQILGESRNTLISMHQR